MAAEETTEEEPKKKKKKIVFIIPAVVMLLGFAAGGYFVMGGGGKKATAGEETTTTTAHGHIVLLNPLTTNLSDGHVLKVGVGLEIVAKPESKTLAAVVAAASGGGGHGAAPADALPISPLHGEEAKATDLIISVLGRSTKEELESAEGFKHAKEELQHKIEEAYHHDIKKIYFTTFVMS